MLSFGQEYDLQNLTWTLELLEKLCDQSLADSIQEDLLGLDHYVECGLMYFYLMIRCIISSTEDVVIAMTTKIKNIKVSDFEEETITKVISQLKMVSTRLEVIDKIPENTEKNVIGIIQTSSVPDFNNYFN